MLLLTIIISLLIMKYMSQHIIPEGLFETEDTDEEDKKKRRGMVALTSAYILVLVLVYVFLNLLVVGLFVTLPSIRAKSVIWSLVQSPSLWQVSLESLRQITDPVLKENHETRFRRL
jgi:Na+/H+ antiporter NhaD/arsenite permease-like protein